MSKVTDQIDQEIAQMEAAQAGQDQASTTDSNAMSKPNEAAPTPVEPVAPIAPAVNAVQSAVEKPVEEASITSVPKTDYDALSKEYQKMKDKLNGTTGQLAQRIKDLEHQNEVLQLKTQRSDEVRDSASPAQSNAGDEIDPELESVYGPEGAKALAKAISKATSQYKKENDALKQQLAALPESLKKEMGAMSEQQRQQVEANTFKAQVIAKMPGIETLCEGDTPFNQWLNMAGDGFGGVMMQRWNDAFNNRNLDGLRKVVSEFSSFCKRTGQAMPLGLEAEKSIEAPANSGNGLLSKVTPSRSSASTLPTSGSEESLTVESVSEAEDVLAWSQISPGRFSKAQIEQAQKIVDRFDREGLRK